ncbi:MAG: hypothetical protein EA359_16645 [Balneolaceae bacterium]|nr:MAG: hypothetical protein EA359_16645 [Balneolaceae bacterium]
MERDNKYAVDIIKDHFPKGLIIFILIVSSAILYAGYQFYQAEVEQTRSQKETTLASIASLKVNQITDWYLDELFDANVITQNSILREAAIRYTQNATAADSSSIVMMMKQIKEEHDYADIFMTTMDGHILVGTSSVISSIDSIELLGIERASQKGGSVSTDLFRTDYGEERRIFITFISAIYDDNRLPIVAMVYRFDSDQYLYPLIESWPVPSHTS